MEVWVGVCVGVSVLVGVCVGVSVLVGVCVEVWVGVWVGVSVAVSVLVLVLSSKLSTTLIFGSLIMAALSTVIAIYIVTSKDLNRYFSYKRKAFPNNR